MSTPESPTSPYPEDDLQHIREEYEYDAVDMICEPVSTPTGGSIRIYAPASHEEFIVILDTTAYQIHGSSRIAAERMANFGNGDLTRGLVKTLNLLSDPRLENDHDSDLWFTLTSQIR